jgi:asparagine synthase (glutamine-hydrolysing)
MHGFLVSTSAASVTGTARASACLRAQGLILAFRYTYGATTVEAFRAGHQPETTAIGWAEQGRAFLCVGWLRYGQSVGAQALRAIADDAPTLFAFRALPLAGQAVVIAAYGDEVCVRTDAMGLLHVYFNEAQSLTSNSWLAALSESRQPKWNEQACLEYVLLGAPHALDTPMLDVVRWPRASCITMKPEAAPTLTTSPHGGTPPRIRDFEGTVGSFAKRYREIHQSIAQASPGGLSAALSGGFDSRLILAASLACGATPRLFVYGTATDEDVVIAKSAATQIGLSIDHIDKSQRTSSPSSDGSLAQALYRFDGWSLDGSLDSAIDFETRVAQSAHAATALNGGGGEILRDFYYLAENRGSARTIIDAFYRRVPNAIFLDRARVKPFFERMRLEIERAVGVTGSYTRESLERCYPLYRCQHWMGRNNTINVRFGSFVTPLLDSLLVDTAARIPREWKRAGKFEAALITQLHRPLASVTSAYGWPFSVEPPKAARYAAIIKELRPVQLRGLLSRWKQGRGLQQYDATGDPFANHPAHPLAGVLDTRLLRHSGNEPAMLGRYRTLGGLADWLQTDPFSVPVSALDVA